MGGYELKFIVDALTLTDETVDALGATEDVLCGGTGYGDGFVTITAAAESAREAVQVALAKLRLVGLRVFSLQRDLVSISAIAERTGATRQGVHHWVRGNRRSAFPAPFDPVNGLWLWGEVQRWALAEGIAVDDADVRYPSRGDHDWAGLLIAEAVPVAS